MSDISIRIFESVKGDPIAIQNLAAAIAAGDGTRVHDILAEKGVVLEDAEIASVMSTATTEAGPANFTFTFT